MKILKFLGIFFFLSGAMFIFVHIAHLVRRTISINEGISIVAFVVAFMCISWLFIKETEEK